MAITKSYTREAHDAGRMDKIQSLTAASTGTVITNYGVTVISSTQAKTFRIAAPIAGIRKSIAVITASTDDVTTFDGNGATLLEGSTSMAIDGPGGFEMVGISTSAWVLTGVVGIVTT